MKPLLVVVLRWLEDGALREQAYGPIPVADDLSHQAVLAELISDHTVASRAVGRTATVYRLEPVESA